MKCQLYVQHGISYTDTEFSTLYYSHNYVCVFVYYTKFGKNNYVAAMIITA